MPSATRRSDVKLDIRKLSSALGAEIIGLDLMEPLTPDRIEAVHDAILAHQVLVFRDQHLSGEQQIEFSKSFGGTLQKQAAKEMAGDTSVKADMEGAAPGNVILLSNLDKEGKPRGTHPNPASLFWHTDGCFHAKPGKYTFLYGVEVTQADGATEFANLYTAYTDLPATTKERVAALSIVHDVDYLRARARGQEDVLPGQFRAGVQAAHPIVRVHPETARQVMYVGGHASHVVDMPVDEGRGLIAELNDHATQRQYVYAHHWAPGDFVMWDNRCLLHRSTEYDLTREHRVLRRTTVIVE